MLETDTLKILQRSALQKLDAGFASLPAIDAAATSRERISEVLASTAERLHDNFPYFHPLYAGQMLKPPHPVARLAYALAQWINPNNHALDGGRASSAMEKEAVAEIAAMFGWTEHLGHLTGGGTMANLEALWVAGRLEQGKTILASAQAHYTHQRISAVLQLPFETIPCDARGRMDVEALRKRLRRGDVGTVVATMGTTATGSVDPLAEILELSDQARFPVPRRCRVWRLLSIGGKPRGRNAQSFDQIAHADSIVIDPHKHGLQPYGCGCVLFRDPTVGRLYNHDSPYTYLVPRNSIWVKSAWSVRGRVPRVWRSGPRNACSLCASAANSRTPSSAAGKLLAASTNVSPRTVPFRFSPELDIVVFAPRAASVEEASALTRRIYQAAAEGICILPWRNAGRVS